MQVVSTFLKANQPRFVDELSEYVRFPSVSAQARHRRDLQACARWLVQHCRRVGLSTRLVPTAGHPIVLAQTPRTRSSRKPHFLVYGHYDVQPPEPLDLWQTPPFEPVVRNGALYGRGASDNKGQHLAHLKAIEAYLSTGCELPCDLTFLIEGEEEVGSSHLAEFLEQHRTLLACEAVIISDNGMPAKDLPALTYALRGIAAMEITVHGPSRDLHSGLYGGSIDNPALVLCQLLAQLRSAHGKITIPGFYDPVIPLTSQEKRQLARIPHDDAAYREFLGVPGLFGEKGCSTAERRSARPTFEINGLTSGYQGEGSKTIIPAWASAKITLRLVPDQKPERVLRQTADYLRKLCPPTVRLEIQSGHGGAPYFVSPDNRFAQAGLRALETAFEREPVLMREGGSIPIVSDFKRVLGVDTLLLGLALPDDNPHSPNEKFDLDNFARGIWMSANLWQELVR
jgi:acetylornithine deacetylase/succinyl-diaminopimelate desuccinylase-like protein